MTQPKASGPPFGNPASRPAFPLTRFEVLGKSRSSSGFSIFSCVIECAVDFTLLSTGDLGPANRKGEVGDRGPDRRTENDEDSTSDSTRYKFIFKN